jgi:hypothetical protein
MWINKKRVSVDMERSERSERSEGVRVEERRV